VYGVVDSLAERAAAAATGRHALPPEQHLLAHDRVARENGVDVVVPPLHHQVITARIRPGTSTQRLRRAARDLERALAGLDERYPATARGLAVAVAWGLPYFERFVPVLADGRRFPDYLPVDLRASEEAGKRVGALLDAVRFPSDPESTILERNDVCIQLRSDFLEHLADGAGAVLGAVGDVLDLTSVRRGFVGRSVDGGSLPREMALRAGVPHAGSIPRRSPLFLGFTSTPVDSLGAGRIANLETLPGLTDQWPDGYFRNGTILHLSHIAEDLELWYRRPFVLRIWNMFDPGSAAEQVPDGTATLPVGDIFTRDQILQFAQDGDGGITGHSSNMHPENRLPEAVVDSYGERRPVGAAILQRVDFNTLDNPFFWTAQPRSDRFSKRPLPGVHFLSFAPTSNTFNRIRLAMDGRYRDGVVVPIGPRAPEQGLNAVLRTTHRQNFIVPPRRHRSFPLLELV
jgi:hypothetical protein